MKWVRTSWGVKTHVDARRSSNEHLRNAIELISDKAIERTIYTHTGWREIDGQMVYLTNGSAIGKPEVEAEMDFQLSRYYLPQPKGDAKTAIEKSFEFLYIGDLPVTLPLLTAVYLAPLNPFLETCFTLWYVGPTGALKSVLSGLALSHYGNFSHKTLPASWRDTKNQLEKLLFLAKDILLVIDDWAPAEDINSMREMESKAEYIIRAQGNRQAKGRMKPNMSSQTIFIPRGMLLSSGEQLPSGQSRNARVLPVRIERKNINLDNLTEAQKNKGYYAQAMTQYVLWMREHWKELEVEIPKKYEEYQQLAVSDNTHLRMSEVIALMQTGLWVASRFFEEKGILNASMHKAILDDGWKIFTELASKQNLRVSQERSGKRFIEALRSLYSMGMIKLISMDASLPSSPEIGQTPIGWNDVSNGFIYLAPLPAYTAIYNYCNRAGEPFTFKRSEVWQDLKSLGYIQCKTEEPTDGKWINGKTERVLWLKAEVLFPQPPIEAK